MSEKFKLIDHETFENIHQSTSSATTRVTKIRNAKYKRMTSSIGFNLLEFVKPKANSKGTKNRGKLSSPKRVVDVRSRPSFKKKGKQRENGRKKKINRLKKSILRYRQLKRNQQQTKEMLEAQHKTELVEQLQKETEIVNQLQSLTIVSENQQSKKLSEVSKRIHSNRFRDYCENCTTPILEKHTEHLLRELNRFQRRAYAQNQIKAKAHRRFVVGFREVQNFLCISKVKLVVIATDCERCEGEVGLDETISAIKKQCQDQQVPIVFAFQRRQLAYILYKKASISCIGILDYDGMRDTFQEVMINLHEARKQYQLLMKHN
ncbi:selenocysteine insertion sequence-binding protein 2 [Musca vetustissima]|uniref:selenocysteine insertion sequence-binding protein 2 n=1 Tax=Musca vetustissima TaxID=27455 RepID=UPI002AB7E688|nr:selenocysteine insertion sequence-binding protein 2 [Musca vetustissima]